MRFRIGQKSQRRVHICTMATDQHVYYRALVSWLRRHGYHLITDRDATPIQRCAAAGACDLCLLLLGPNAGPNAPNSSFTLTELEANTAWDTDPNKVLVFAQATVVVPATPEQADFIERQRSFVGGSFQATCASPTEFIAQVATAVPLWHATAHRVAQLAAQPAEKAIMISSTGDLLAERAAARAALTRRRLPIIDYQTAASEALAPIERVLRWAQSSRILLLILGYRYGYVSPVDGLGVTELEFVTALTHGRPIIAFLRRDAFTTTDPDQQQFVARVQQFVPTNQQFVFADAADIEQTLAPLLKNLQRCKPAPLPSITVEQSRAWYRRHLHRWLGAVTIPGRAQTMPLTTMILTLATKPVDPTITDEPNGFGSVYIPDYPPDIPTLSPAEALMRSERLYLVGGPGSGKSTVLGWFALQAAEQQMPIAFSLSVYATARTDGSVGSLLEFVAIEERRLLLATSPLRSRWCTLLETGQGLLLLDDLDRVPRAARAMVLRDITACAASLPAATRIVVADRNGADLLPDSGFTRYDMAPLGQGQQQLLIAQWLQHLAAEDGDGLATRKRVMRVLYQLRFLRDRTQWARSPLLLGLFTTVSDSTTADERPILTALVDESIYRRAMRALLQRDTPACLRAKEMFLQALASHMFTTPPDAPLTTDAVAQIWKNLPSHITTGVNRDALVAALGTANDLLIQQEGGYAFFTPSFWAYFAAQGLSTMPASAREAVLLRRRLSDRWGSVLSALTYEFDRQGRQDEATQIIQAFLQADQAPLFDTVYGDPFHIAAIKATYGQAVRANRLRAAEPGPSLAHIWQHVWRENQYGLRQQAVTALYMLGPAAADAIEVLVEATQSQGAWDAGMIGQATAALRQLAFLGNAAAQNALAATHSTPSTASAEYPLGVIDASLDELCRGLDAPDRHDRLMAVVQIRKFGRLAQQCIPALIRLLDDDDSFTVMETAQALRGMGSAAAPAAAALAQAALRDDVSLARVALCGALQALGSLASPAVPVITAALHAPDAKRRYAAISITAALGTLMTQVGSTIIEMIVQDSDASFAAGEAFVAIQCDITPLLLVLRHRLQSGDYAVQRDALMVIANLGEIGAPLCDDIVALTKTHSSAGAAATLRLINAALVTLGHLKTGAAPALPTITRALQVPELQVSVLQAINLLGLMALPLLTAISPFFAHADPSLRQQALTAVQHMGAPATTELMKQIVPLLHDTDHDTRWAAFSTACILRPLLPLTLHALVTAYAQADQRDLPHYFVRLIETLQQVNDAGLPASAM